jgi:MFS family permease
MIEKTKKKNAGIRLGAILFSLLVFIGQIVFACGALFNLIWLMDLGRSILGIGSESLAVAQNAYAVTWFFGRELNLVFGLTLSVARLGSTINMNVMVPIYEAVSKTKSGKDALGTALLIASTTCVFSFICACILGLLDMKRSRIKSSEPFKAGNKMKFRHLKFL